MALEFTLNVYALGIYTEYNLETYTQSIGFKLIFIAYNKGLGIPPPPPPKPPPSLKQMSMFIECEPLGNLGICTQYYLVICTHLENLHSILLSNLYTPWEYTLNIT